jgi:hypothetical protein
VAAILPPHDDKPDPHSSFKLVISLEIGYERKRAVLGGAFESRVTTLVLLVGGVAVALLVVVGLLHIAQGLPF